MSLSGYDAKRSLPDSLILPSPIAHCRSGIDPLKSCNAAVSNIGCRFQKGIRAMNTQGVHGLHHITAIAGPAQENLDFYAGVLGMRLVKKSVNQDDPTTYHLFYADAIAPPGTVLPFFPLRAVWAPR